MSGRQRKERERDGEGLRDLNIGGRSRGLVSPGKDEDEAIYSICGAMPEWDSSEYLPTCLAGALPPPG